MGQATNISWCDSTWNPWRGCEKVSPGCMHCYAEGFVERRLHDMFTKRHRHEPPTFNAPLRWNKKPWVCDECGGNWNMKWDCCGESNFHRRRVFLGSLMDWLDPKVPVQWLSDALDIVRQCQGLDFLMLTKCPQLFTERLGMAMKEAADKARAGFSVQTQWIADWVEGKSIPDNVWMGASVEDQKRADERIPALLQIPAKVRFLSCEPLLEWVDLERVNFPTGVRENVLRCEVSAIAKPIIGKLNGIDWVIVGLESGAKRRDPGIAPLKHIVDQCRAAGVPCMVKQDSAHKPGEQGRIPGYIWEKKEFPKV